jgi:DNA-binding MarR family transcriptional regulator
VSTDLAFGTQLIGQAESALGAILDRELTGTGLTQPRWVILTLAVLNDGTIEHHELVGRAVRVLKTSQDEAEAQIANLADAELVEASAEDAVRVRVTDAGQRLHSRIRLALAEITQRLWGDLPADDLSTAGRVLGTVLERANAELA